jgi:dCMP deaminase
MSNKKKVPPREVPTRDEYYMGEAFWIASKSKDPRTQVGAVLVGANNDPISTGYNGPPRIINDNDIDWDRPAKYPYIVHAEDNAIKRAKRKIDLRGATLYVTAPPCKACMLDIVDAEIARVVYFRPKTDSGSLLANDEEWATTQDIARRGMVRLDQFQGNLNWMRDRIAWMESIGVFG